MALPKIQICHLCHPEPIQIFPCFYRFLSSVDTEMDKAGENF